MHQAIPDSLAFKIVKRVQAGMGFIPLHSAHQSKPFTYLMGTSGSLSWREGDFCRIWTVAPAHPIARGIPEAVELCEEEMYGEPFDIPTPEETIFISWYGGGEVFRSGCTWKRGYGKIFYFQPGHETSPSYHNPYVLKIIENAVYWTAPTVWRKDFSCPNIVESPEKKRADKG
jgi:trehalose utilization protein